MTGVQTCALQIWRIAVPGAVAQSVAATAAGWAIALQLGWSSRAGLILGMALAVASTVVLVRMLGEWRRLGTRDGHVAVGWLIVEDLFTVVALVILPAIAIDSAEASDLLASLGMAMGKVALFAVLVWLLGRSLFSPLLERLARSSSPEFFTLSVFVLALSVAAVAASVFHVSVALGAFLGGMVVAQSRVGHQAAADILPFRDVFSALFFVSIGMLVKPAFVLENPLLILATLAVVLILKPLVALFLVLLLRGTAATATTVAVGLAQIGEFSFILAALGRSLDLLPEVGFNLVVATAILSIALNPLLFRLAPLIERGIGWLLPGTTPGQPLSEESEIHAAASIPAPVLVLAGYGRTGRRIAQSLGEAVGRIVVIDRSLDAVDQASADGHHGCFGKAESPELLAAAGLAEAATLVIATPALAEKLGICLAARKLNPRLRILAFSDNESESAWLREFGADDLIDAHAEAAAALRARLLG